MTIDVLFERGIRRVRRADWMPRRYLQLEAIGPLRSPYGVLHNEDGTARDVPVWRLNESDWLAYEGQATYKRGTSLASCLGARRKEDG